MEVIDEQGRLFGVVNVIDALVVLVALAIAGAGAAIVLDTGETDSTHSQYATLSYSVPLDSDAATLDAGDQLSSIHGDESYEVVDVYRSFAPDGSAHVVVRATYDGEFTANDHTLYGGDHGDFSTSTYRVNASVLGVNQSTDSLATRTVPVVLETTVRPPVARSITEGQTATIGDHTVATVETVQRGPVVNDRQRVWVGVELVAWENANPPTYDGTALRVGNRVTVVTDSVVIPGRIEEVGTTQILDGTDD